MRTLRFALPLLPLLLLLAAPAAAQPPQLDTFQLLLFEKGPNRPAEMPPGGDALHKDHLAYFARLQSEGKVVVLGPFGGDGPMRGVAIVQAADMDAAKVLFAADPSVKAGRLMVTPMVLWSAPENFQKPANSGETELVYFGFLRSGPSRGQDPETAKRLQAEHLAHMADQHKQGKLLVAGPLGEGAGDRRGIVVYRVPTMEDARARAEADPAVKAGRLVVDLYAWTVPKGVFSAR